MPKGNLVDFEKAEKHRRKIQNYIKTNIKIGSKIKSRIERGTKNEYYELTLDRIEGKHFLFKNERGWIQAFTLPQLCYNIENRLIKIVKESKEENENVKK